MSWFRAPLRLVDSHERDAELAAALRDWSVPSNDVQAVARLEQRLTAALAPARVSFVERGVSAWLLGLAAVSAAILLTFSLRAATMRELDAPRAALQRDAIAAGPTMLEMASRLGVGPRELAAQEAMDPLQPIVRR